MQKTHELKIAPEYYNQVALGSKTFEIRKNDRNFETGDVVHLKEWVDGNFTGRIVSATVGYVCGYEQKEGMVVFSLLGLQDTTYYYPQGRPSKSSWG